MLSYENIKAILQYLTVEKRSDICHRCPAIRTPDSQASLRMNSLQFHPGCIIINHRMHQFSTFICLRSEAETPHLSTFWQKFEPCDVLENGRLDKENQYTMVPGDVEIEFEEEDRQVIHLGYQGYVRKFVKYTVDDFGTQSNKTRYLKNVKIRNCLKSLANKSLGGRKIYVKHLKISKTSGILRLPENLKIHAQNIQTHPNALNAISSIINSNFPLESLTLETVLSTESCLKTEIVRRAQLLRILQIPLMINEDLLDLETPRIEICDKKRVFSHESTYIFVEKWANSGRKCGDYFLMMTRPCAMRALGKRIKEELVATMEELEIIDPKDSSSVTVPCLSIAMNNPSLELIVYTTSSDSDEMLLNFCMEVMEK